ncbi:hypothetical protein N7466_011390 [Penicillium verhagenii]|uniref:uncharacterized protein n=1 Tax=Penicillium verhagenii TaxID=1562060 RepID=UPI002545654D|nr:uncharacterized protein N7466_011390 [Penicillium verhagenii]KAJ5915457.1 hypothetical protein N7466_011390 [Penicillium verhagenii]
MLFIGALLLSLLHNAVAQRHDADLMSFVTLPEVRALKWEVTHHDRAREAPGYWFVAPYGQISPESPTQKYQQYQVGPYIYDNDGVLVWAGPSLYDNRNAFDFRANLNMDGEPHLSFIVAWDNENGADRGHGVIVDKHYQIEKEVLPLVDVHDFNMHEFNILDGGKTVLACVYRQVEVDLADFGRPNEKSWVVSGGFAEFDIETNEILTQWNSLDHIALHESNMFHAWDGVQGAPGWDYVHANAVDKNAAGDYIISMRFTNTIYGISGLDGNVMWRLGGLESDFVQDFTFSKQHDVKFVSSNGTHHVISFLNNASDERGNDENLSSVLHVELNTETMTAHVIKRFNRPDAGLTRLRGSAEVLPNGNVFIGWSERGYQSEHAPNGDLLMTARFSSTRYSTYRAYKSEFTGRPLTPPDVVASVYGTSNTDITTIFHVSWNGATDVAGWNFYAKAYDRGDSIYIGHANKTDFETMYIVDGYMDWVSAEAVDRDGNPMMISRVVRSDIPSNWQAVGFLGAHSPSPDDPTLISSVYENSKTQSDDSTDSAESTDTTESTDGTDATIIEDNTEAADTIDDTSSDSMDGMDMGESSGSGSTTSSYSDAKEVAMAVNKAYDVIRGVGALLIFILVSCTVGVVGFACYRMFQGRKGRSYHHISSEEDHLPTEEIHLRSQAAE